MSDELARVDSILPRAEMIDPTKVLVIIQHDGKVYSYEGETAEVTFETEYTRLTSHATLAIEFAGRVTEREVTL